MKVFRNFTGLVLLFVSAMAFAQQKAARWFPEYDFKFQDFQKPPVEFAPFARWW